MRLKVTEEVFQRGVMLDNVPNSYDNFLKHDICEEKITGVCVLGTNEVPEPEWSQQLSYNELQKKNVEYCQFMNSILRKKAWFDERFVPQQFFHAWTAVKKNVEKQLNHMRVRKIERFTQNICAVFISTK